ncbi:hypothetical protein VSR01_10050 [Actinacidiphila sp. DG2A-62]|nr:hypothetical protein [Actinacidiphila sp. DG2A-62]MEC3993865.1 hypothetical protein [Actinacidiphila sp. DG2A-62]
MLTLTTGAGAGAVHPEVLAALAFFELADLATFLDSPLLGLL